MPGRRFAHEECLLNKYKFGDFDEHPMNGIA